MAFAAQDPPPLYLPGPLILSPLELEVVRLVGHGRNNQEIGDKLALSAHTVEGCVTSIILKMEGRST